MRRPPRRRSACVAALAPALFAFAVGIASGCGVLRGALAYGGVYADRVDPERLDANLRPHDEWLVPVGDGPFPGLLLVPGCVGTQPFERTWADLFVRAGYAVLIVDSFTPRGVTTREALEAVCEGEHVWGFERAGDVLVSLDRLRARPEVDAQRLGLIGWSHGAWAVMDAVALGAVGRRPPLLDRLPAKAISGVRAAALFYPYCGFGSFARNLGWSPEVAGLLVIAARDQNIPPGPCRNTAEALRAQGAPLDVMLLDADHWFDNPEGFDLVAHRHDPVATADVRDRILALLRERLRPMNGGASR